MSELIALSDRIRAFVRSRVSKKGVCWHRSDSDRAKTKINSVSMTIRRITYWEVFGVDIKGRNIFMECGDESCVNPHHFLPKGKKPLGGEDRRKPYGSGKQKRRPEISLPDFYAKSLAKSFKKPKPRSLPSILIDDDPGLPCVYAIRCKANGGIYIGKAKNLARRAIQHVGKLGRNVHVNKKLQADWNKYGAASFTMEVMEVCQTSEESLAKELEAIHEFSAIAPTRLYNTAGNAARSPLPTHSP